jgi:hypothetical protein
LWSAPIAVSKRNARNPSKCSSSVIRHRMLQPCCHGQRKLSMRARFEGQSAIWMTWTYPPGATHDLAPRILSLAGEASECREHSSGEGGSPSPARHSTDEVLSRPLNTYPGSGGACRAFQLRRDGNRAAVRACSPLQRTHR